LQHNSPRPHSSSFWQALHELLLQTRPAPHSASPQQFPFTHDPPQHTWPAAHSAFDVHSEHW
jgi:hypothetical protein